jgi:ribosome maturation factor RimP
MSRRLLRPADSPPALRRAADSLDLGRQGWTLVAEEVMMHSADEKRLAGLIEPVVAAVGMDLESVRVSTAGKRRLLRIVVDSDHGVSLDDAAEVSRAVSAELDRSDAMGDHPYTLEVSSPGVDRPLTEPKHWRRAVGRLVHVPLAAGDPAQGRIVVADMAGVTLEADGVRQSYAYGELGAGTIEVEFGRLDSLSEADAEADGDGH